MDYLLATVGLVPVVGDLVKKAADALNKGDIGVAKSLLDQAKLTWNESPKLLEYKPELPGNQLTGDIREKSIFLTPAQQRQHDMLEDNQGFNISPNSWDSFPAIGREGTYITDKQAITDVIGDFPEGSSAVITRSQAAELEKALGLQMGSIQDGFKIRQVYDLKNNHQEALSKGLTITLKVQEIIYQEEDLK